MHHPLDDVSCARLPSDALPRLAPLRCTPGVQAAKTPDALWLRWEPGADRVLRSVLPLHGAELFAVRHGRWHRFGQALPAFDFPADLDFQPLYQLLFPAPVQPLPATDAKARPVRLQLRTDETARPTTALCCLLSCFIAWADTVPSFRLTTLRGAVRGERLLVLGDRLPLLDGERFWGRAVLVPLGLIPDPALPESALRTAAGVDGADLLVLRPEGGEVVPGDVLGPLSRAGPRLALPEARA